MYVYGVTAPLVLRFNNGDCDVCSLAAIFMYMFSEDIGGRGRGKVFIAKAVKSRTSAMFAWFHLSSIRYSINSLMMLTLAGRTAIVQQDEDKMENKQTVIHSIKCTASQTIPFSVWKLNYTNIKLYGFCMKMVENWMMTEISIQRRKWKFWWKKER